MQTGENTCAEPKGPEHGQNRIAESRVRVRGATRGMGKLSGTDKTAAQDRTGTKSMGKHDPPAAAPRLRQATGSGAMGTGGSTKGFAISVAGPRAATVARIHCVLLCMSSGHNAQDTKTMDTPLRPAISKSKPRNRISSRNSERKIPKCTLNALLLAAI